MPWRRYFPSHWRRDPSISLRDYYRTVVTLAPRAIVVADRPIPAISAVEYYSADSNRVESLNEGRVRLQSGDQSIVGVEIDATTGVPNSTLAAGSSRSSSTTGTDIEGAGAYSERLSNVASEFMQEIGIDKMSLTLLKISSISSPIFYYEICVDSDLVGDGGVSVGFAVTSDDVSSPSFSQSISVCYQNSGRVVVNGSARPNTIKEFSKGSVVGCGIEIGGQSRVFFTYDGRIVSDLMNNVLPVDNSSIFPILLLEGESTKILSNFGTSRFVFSEECVPIANLRLSHSASRDGNNHDWIQERILLQEAVASPTQALTELIWQPEDNQTVLSTLALFEQILLAARYGTAAQTSDSFLHSSEVMELPPICANPLLNNLAGALSDGLKTLSGLVTDSPSTAPMTKRSMSPASPARKTFFSGLRTEMIDVLKASMSDVLLPRWIKLQKIIENDEGSTSTSELHEYIELSVKISGAVEDVETFFNFKLPKPAGFDTHNIADELRNADESASSRPNYLRSRGSTEPILSYSMNNQMTMSGREGGTPQYNENNATTTPNRRVTVISSPPQSAVGSSSSVFTSQPMSAPGGSMTNSNQSRPRKNSGAVELDNIYIALGSASHEEVDDICKLIFLASISDSVISPECVPSRWGDRVRSMKSNQERLHWVRNIALNDGLSVVLKALPRCCPWPQVELHVFKAVAVLSQYEVNYNTLMQNFNELIKVYHALLDGMVDEDRFMPNSVSDMIQTVAFAVINIAGIIKLKWDRAVHENNKNRTTADSSKPPMGADRGRKAPLERSSYASRAESSGSRHNNSMLSSDYFSDGMVDSFPPRPLALSHGRSGEGRSNSAPVYDFEQNMESLLELIERIDEIIMQELENYHELAVTGKEIELSEENVPVCSRFGISRWTLLVCDAISKLSSITPLKQMLISKDVLRLYLKKWIRSSTSACSWYRKLATQRMNASPDRITATREWSKLVSKDKKLFSMVEIVSTIICNICIHDRKDYVNVSGDFQSLEADYNYTIGMTDAKMSGDDIVSEILKLIHSLIPSSVFEENAAIFNDNPIITSGQLRASLLFLSSAVNGMTFRAQNRSSLVKCGAVSALCSLFVVATVHTMRYKKTHASSIAEFPTEEYGTEEYLKLLKIESDDDEFLSKVASSCLNALSFYLEDARKPSGVRPGRSNSTSRSSSQPPVFDSGASASSLPEVVNGILSPHVLDGLKIVVTLRNEEALLAACRVIFGLSDWPQAVKQMHDVKVTDILTSIIRDYDETFTAREDPRHTIMLSTTNSSSSGFSTPTSERNSQSGVPKPRSSLKRGTSDDVAQLNDITKDIPRNVVEIILRSMYFIAQVAEGSFDNAATMFHDGIISVMVSMANRFRNHNPEIERQALRIISAMCPVLSSTIPGGHPAQVIEKMKYSAHISRNDPMADMKKKRLEFNMREFVDILRSLAHSLVSPSSPIQREALRGISFLAADDQLKVSIVEGPLRQIIRIFVDPSTDIEVRDIAEQVIVNLGFLNGRRDLELVANDVGLLSDWFYLKKSLRPQSLAYDLILHWVHTMFFGEENAERWARRRFIMSALRSGSETVQTTDVDTLSFRLPGGATIDFRDTLDLPGLAVIRELMELYVNAEYGHQKSTANINWAYTSGSAELRDALYQQFVFLFDTWTMLHRLYLPSDRNTTPQSDPEQVKINRVASRDGFHTPVKKSPASTGGTLHSFGKYLSQLVFQPRSGSKDLGEEERTRMEQLDRELLGPLSNISGGSIEQEYNPLPFYSYIKKSNSVRRLLDILPSKKDYGGSSSNTKLGKTVTTEVGPRIIDLFEVIFPSKIMQFYLMDLCCLGMAGSTNSDASFHSSPLSNRMGLFRVPQPLEFRALLLPTRRHVSFQREGKVIERIILEVSSGTSQPTFFYNTNTLAITNAAENKDSQTSIHWAIEFRDSVLDGDFYTDFLDLIRRCPSIATLSFAMAKPTDDSRLVYLAGDLPATVKFLVFENALSSHSLQALCILLRQQNPAWTSKRRAEKSHRQTDVNQPGLHGLVIRKHALTQEDITQLVELVVPADRVNIVFGRGKFLPAHLKLPPAPRCGIRFLDLSNNGLTDEQCAVLVRGAAYGSLEALDLRKNMIYSGHKTLAAVKAALNNPSLILNSLSFASCHLTADFISIFFDLTYSTKNSSLVAIDVSDNAVYVSDNSKIGKNVQALLRHNSTLRYLDLSFNALNNDTVKAIHLGLLQNTTILILKLSFGDVSHTIDPELFMVSLRKNREMYAGMHIPGSAAHQSAPRRVDETNASSDDLSADRMGGDGNNLATDRKYRKEMNDEFTSGSESSGSNGIHVKRSASDYSIARGRAGSTAQANKLIADSSEVVHATPAGLSVNVSLANNPTATAEAVPVATAYVVDDSAQPGDRTDDSIKKSADTAHQLLKHDGRNVLCILFSAPLAWRSKNSLRPIEMLNYKQERDAIWQGFRQASRNVELHFNFATTETLRTVVTLGCRALHFSGHGHPDWLNFEDGEGGLQIGTAETLRRLCSTGGAKLDFVFVSACHSKNIGQAFADAGVKHVVCVSVDARLLDAAAIAFTRAFYQCLAVGETVANAFEVGKHAVFASPSMYPDRNGVNEGDKFILLPTDAAHDVPIFTGETISSWPPPCRLLKSLEIRLPQRLPQPPEDFEGREIEMYEVIQLLMKRHLVTIFGPRGIGKSAVAKKVMWYLLERSKFENGAIFVELEGVRTYTAFLCSMIFALVRSPPVSLSLQQQQHLAAVANVAATAAGISPIIMSGSTGAPPHAATPTASMTDKGLSDDSVLEALFLDTISHFKMLIVLDGVDDAVAGCDTSLRIFLGRLFQNSPDTKVLLTSCAGGIGMRGANVFGIVENTYELRPLKLYNTLRLLARLNLHNEPSNVRNAFIKSMMPPPHRLEEMHVHSTDDLPEAAMVLELLGGGHPDKIVKLACEYDANAIAKLQHNAGKIYALASGSYGRHREPIRIITTSTTNAVSEHSFVDDGVSTSPIAAPRLAVPPFRPGAPLSFLPASLGIIASAGPIDPLEFHERDVTEEVKTSSNT